MKQYGELKSQYPDAVLLFRVGDFYETFGADAILSSNILGIVLTKRANGAASHVELAGFPHHSLESYLPKLIKAGLRVAICDQLEDPKLVKGIVKRGITELVTPGAHFNNHVLDQKKNNFLAAIKWENAVYGLALCDVSTGSFYATEGSKAEIEQCLGQFQPSEVLYEKSQRTQLLDAFPFIGYSFPIDTWAFHHEHAYERLTRQWGTHSLKGFGLENLNQAIAAAGALLHYLNETKHQQLRHLNQIQIINNNRFVWLDRFTIRNLELLEPSQESGQSLFQSLDACQTPMGSRRLRRWIASPLINRLDIELRLQTTEALVINAELRQQVKPLIHSIGDMERLVSRLGAMRCSPRELVHLSQTLNQITEIKKLFNEASEPILQTYSKNIPDTQAIGLLITNQLRPDAPAQIGKGPVFNKGLDATLDHLQSLVTDGKQHLIEIQQREIQATGIASLKIAYNSVFGYYLEVTHAHKEKVPASWIRKQTLTNAERYITPELKTYEETILGAEERILKIEQNLYTALCTQLLEFVPTLMQSAQQMAQLDVYGCFAELAYQRSYCKPVFHDGQEMEIKQGRHPVIETLLKEGNAYIANDLYLNSESIQMMMITGPNMSGKSAVLRQTALIVIMAQIGCFVPAQSALLPITDRIFTRVGASDNISTGESTFMVEMNETASILHNLSAGSLILLDEIGRGTSTYDGISIAWSIARYLHEHRLRPKTLFATHYHELNDMQVQFKRIKNFNVSVKEHGSTIVFLRRLQEGGSAHSFGIHVAKMAGMPESVIREAQQKLKELEQLHPESQTQLQLRWSEPETPETHLKWVKELESLDLDRMSPMEALLTLQNWKSKYPWV